MKENSSSGKPVYFIGSFLLLILVLSALSLCSFELGGIRIKPYPFNRLLSPSASYAPAKHFLQAQPGDSSVASEFQFAAGEPLLKDFSEPGHSSLCAFMQRLNDSKKRKVRIAYYGDSMIEGDLITQTLRELLQQKFGGKGVGLVPFTSPVAGFRQSISHSFDGNWKQSSLIGSKGLPPPGVMGYCFLACPDSNASGGTYANFRLREQGRQQCVILYGKHDQPAYCLTICDGKKDSLLIPPAKEVGLLPLKDLEKKSLRISFGSGNPLPLYGISFEDSVGVYIDNLPFRGNSGLALDAIPGDILQQTQALRPYDLIVLQFGINVVSDGMKNYTWYKAGMSRVLSKFKKAMPGVPIMLVGVADKSVKNETGYHTPEALKILIETQESLAREHGCIFYNFYESMGGEGSMVRWVSASPPMANLDYTHLNFRGARKAGSLLFDALITEKKACDLHSKAL